MREETESWLNRVALGVPTQHATAKEAHNRLMLTKALDLSAKRRQPVALPLAPDEECLFFFSEAPAPERMPTMP